ncbi:potassium transporter TrkA [Halovenus sp. HT40]|uniref:potassium transporter TrkA n=1 Tax=Halovenus sp. HT40 TaxID=3126691 RepID=UPI00300F6296
MSVALTTVSTVESAASITTQLLGIAAMATLPAAVAALVYRSLAEEKIPGWLAVAVGVSVVALYLGTAPALEVLLDETDPSQLAASLFDIGGLVGGVGGAALGRAVGDRFGVEVLVWSPTHEASADVSQLAQTVGQVTTVSLPATIEDAPGYDPIPHKTKEDLASTQFVFPRGLTVDELETRISEQLRSDYGIAVADMRFDEYGTLVSLAVGTRAAGIGATLPPATNAVAVRADPGFSASTGDIVQVWEPDSMQRVCTGELRGVADDVVTIAIDAADTPKVDPTRRYRLVTLPVNDRPDREFASLLRAAEETFSTVTVEAGSPLHGLPVGAVDLTITAIRPDDGDPVPFPDREYRLAPGDLLFVIATPGNLRCLEDGATALDPSVASTEGLATDATEPTEGIQTADPTATAREESTGEDGLPATDDGSDGADDQSSAPDLTDEPSSEPDIADEPPSEPDAADESISGKADSDSFKEIKANFEESDQPAETAEPADDSAEPAQAEPTEPTEATDTSSDTASFDELKSEFESGDADWDEGETDQQPTTDPESSPPQQSAPEEQTDDELPESDDIEIAFADDEQTDSAEDAEDDDDGLVSLDEADISFDDDEDEREDTGSDDLGGIDIDDDLQGEADDAISDDLGDLDLDDDEEEDVSELDLSEEDGLFSDVDEDDDEEIEDDEETDDEDDDEDEGDDAEEDDDDSGGGGGGTSFAQLKEEFESGDADWEDDVSDSPGGDMRLDE